MSEFDFWVEAAEIDPKSDRQVGRRTRNLVDLRGRRPEIEAAVQEAVDILRTSASAMPATTEWTVSTLEATFGITLMAEAGIIFGKVGGETSLEITVTIERRRPGDER